MPTFRELSCHLTHALPARRQADRQPMTPPHDEAAQAVRVLPCDPARGYQRALLLCP